MELPEVTPDSVDLRAWDWRAELRSQERTLTWLARKTNRPKRTVYAYSSGQIPPPLQWLTDAARALGMRVSV